MDEVVDILVTTYNTNEKYLKKQIESILRQTYKNMKIYISPVLQAELAYKVLVAVGFRSAQMEVAMGGFACVSQAEEQAQQRHGVRPAAQCHKYLVVQREELVALDVLYYLLHIQL